MIADNFTLVKNPPPPKKTVEQKNNKNLTKEKSVESCQSLKLQVI